MDYNEKELDTESDDDDNENESSESDEDETGDESGGSDDDSDYESVEEVVETVDGEGENGESLKAFSSDDDPERENCPICLNKFIGQDLGSPESCDHTFCFECIKEWSKNINTCPIDRTEFNYIHVKNNFDGSVLRKVKVKVAPKEPEDAVEERPTLCEICHNGNREDRLLLCDGCDLAYHCECLDPPLFYIPIDEWFCPPCSGVFERRAVAGPSRTSARRIIPRTRASETVRSRVQNLRSARTPRSPSVSTPRKTSTQRTTKKKKRRYYRKAIRKVVTLARTKKDMNAGGKGKLGARGSTVIVTYRRCRRRRRRKTKRSVTSSKKSSIPSSKQRIASHLGIGRPLKGSTVPGGSKSRSAVVKIGLPSHSIFGNKHQLMDFSENFNEDMRDTSSTSSRPSQRSSTDACPSTSSCISILDSILEGQKILHAKSDKILIKTDGSLILKEDNKGQNSVKNVEKNQSSRTPMSIALAKQGVRASLSDKNLNSSCKKHADTTKTKNVSDRRTLKTSVNEVPSSSSSKLFQILNNGAKRCNDHDRKKSLYATKSGLGIKTNKALASETVDPNSFTELDGFSNDSPSIRETSVSNNNETNHLSAASNTKNQNYVKLEKSDNPIKNHHTKFNSLSDNFNATLSSLSSAISSKITSRSFVKKEILPDKETNNNSLSADIEKIHIKQEILSDEETNIDSWNKHTNNEEQEFSSVFTNIKKEPMESSSKIDAIKDCTNLELSRNTLTESNYENDLSDCDASQSIIDSVSCDVHNASQINKFCKITKLVKVKEVISDTENYSQSLFLDSISEKFNKLSKLKNLSIKKEPFDSSEDTKSPEKQNAYHKNKRPSCIERSESRNSIFLSKKACQSSKNDLYNELQCTQAVAPLSNSDDDDLPCTQAVAPLSNSDYEDDNLPYKKAVASLSTSDSEDENDDLPSKKAVAPLPSSESEDDDLPCTQAVEPLSDSEDESDDLPCKKAAAPLPSSESEDDDLPYTQAVAPLSNSDSEDESNDLPCKKAAAPLPSSESEDDDLPCTQAVAPLSNSDSENDDLPCKKVATPLPSSESEDDDIPCTQAFPQAISTDSEDDIPSTQAFPAVCSEDDERVCAQISPHAAINSENDLPCTQAVSSVTIVSDVDNSLSCTQADSEDEEDDIPCTQVAFISSKKFSAKCNTVSSFDADKLNSSKILNNLFSPTQNAINSDGQVSSIKADFEFKKPSAISTKNAFSSESSSKYNTNSSRISLMSSFSECDLPPTQAVAFSPSINKDESSNQVFNNLKSVETIQAKHNFDLNDFEESSLPLTQVSSTKQISKLSDTAGMNSNLEQAVTKKIISDSQSSLPVSDSFNLPPTQISKIYSKEQEVSCLANDESFLLPNTQALGDLTQKINFSKDSESVDLIRKEIDFKTNDNNQDFIPDTQALPDTQIVSSNSEQLKSANANDEQDGSICKKDLTEIISNIKQLVNNLSSNVSENENGQNIQNEFSNDKLVPDSSNNSTSNNSENVNETAGSKNVSTEEKNMQSNSSKDVLPEGSKEFDVKENHNSMASSEESDNEEFCLEKFKESLKKPKPATPKKSGVHKHLPQVIATVPVKENLKIKPSNKRTFSFEEVKKLQGLDVEQKSSKNTSSKFAINSKVLENCESDSDLNDSLPATQLVETINNKQCKSNHLQLHTKKYLNEKPSFLSCTSSADENDSFPATQVMISQAKEKDISSENSDSESINFNSRSFQKMNWKNKSVLNRKDTLSATEIPVAKKSDSSNLPDNELSVSPITQRNKPFSSCNKNVKRKKNSDIDKAKKELMTSELDLSNNTDCSVDSTDINDLPATQVCDNLAFRKTDSISESSFDGIDISDTEIHQNDVVKMNRGLENYHFKNSSTSKRKNSFDEIIKNKKICKQIKDKFLNKKSDSNVNVQKNVNECLEITNSVEDLFDSNCKQENLACDKKLKPKKHTNHREKALSSKIIDDLLKEYIRQKNIIKSEKNDSDLNPSVNVQPLDSSTSNSILNLNAIKTERLDPSDDFLPPTQVVNFNHSENDSLPQTQVAGTELVNINRNSDEQNNSVSIQNNFLLPSNIKKEPCYDDDNDDEVSIIELDATSNMKAKELIVIDDDNGNCDTNLVNSPIKQEKEVHPEVINVSCIKKEKCLDANVSLDFEAETKKLWNSYKISKNSVSKEFKEESDDSAKSDLDCQNHNNVEPIKKKKNLIESGSKTSKKEIKSCHNSQAPHEKSRKEVKDLSSKKEISQKSADSHVANKKGDKINKTDVLKSQHKNKTDSIVSTSERKEKVDRHVTLSKNINSSAKYSGPIQCFSDSSKSANDQYSKSRVIENNIVKDKQKNFERENNKHSKEEKSKKSDKDRRENNKHSKEITLEEKSKKSGKDRRENNKLCKEITLKEKCKKSDKDRRENNKPSKERRNSDSFSFEEKSDKDRTENNKHSKKIRLEENSRKSDKDRRENNEHSKEIIDEKSKKSDKDRCSSEKENRNKNNKEVIIPVKPSNKRSYNDTPDEMNQKKRKIDPSLDYESNSSEDVAMQLFNLHNNFHDNHTDLNGGITNGHSMPKDREKTSEFNEIYSKLPQTADIKKVRNKQDLKEEIAHEVKLVLKPFYSTGLISKDDYKDIMRRAVPKIFMNCHHLINPEKIRKLILNYVSLLNNKS